jgi:hypothetical protein
LIAVRDTPHGAVFSVKVHPRAKRDAITGEVGDALKLSLAAPPVDSKANAACVAFLARVLEVSRLSITIVAGANSRCKVIRAAGLTAEQVRSRISSQQLAVSNQQAGISRRLIADG